MFGYANSHNDCVAYAQYGNTLGQCFIQNLDFGGEYQLNGRGVVGWWGRGVRL